MARPVIAISGSANAHRDYPKPLRDLEHAAEACRELGAELAVAGWDLLVFSEDDRYVEAWVAEGYRSSGAAAKGRIRVRQPLDHPAHWQSEQNGARIEHEPVPAVVGWEIAFYGAVLDADAVLLIGGGRATRTAGVIALNRRIPVLAVTLFGGAAEEIWGELTKVENDTDRELRSMMTGRWAPGGAVRLVAALDEQYRRRARRLRAERRSADVGRDRLVRRHAAGLVLFSGAVAAGAAYYGWALAGVVAIAMVAAAGGALISRRGPGSERGPGGSAEAPALVAATRGAFAGLVTVLTYVVSQTLGSGPRDELANASITVFALVVGAVSGFTADRVLARVRPVDVGDLDRFAAPATGALVDRG